MMVTWTLLILGSHATAAKPWALNAYKSTGSTLKMERP